MNFLVIEGDPAGVMQVFQTIDKALVSKYQTYPKTEKYGFDHSLFIVGIEPDIKTKDFLINLNDRITQRFGPLLMSVGPGVIVSDRLKVKLTLINYIEKMNIETLQRALGLMNDRAKLNKK